MNIGTALSMGYTIAQTLNFLTGNFPKIGKKIKEAQKLGYDIEKIVKSFSNMTPEQLEEFENSKLLNSNNPWINATEKLRQNSAAVKGKEYLTKGAKLAAIPLAAYGLQRYLNKSISPSEILEDNLQLNSPNEILQLEQISPENLSPNFTEPMPQPPLNPNEEIGQQVQQQAQSPVIQAKQTTSPVQMQQASQAMPNQQTPIFEQLLGDVDPLTLEPAKQQQLKFLSLISDQLQSKGKGLNDPEFKNLAKRIRSVLGGKPGLIIEENARFQAGQEAKQANVKSLYKEEMQTPVGITEPSKIEKPQEIKKGESVITEDGNIAEVKGTSGNNFLIEENGKVRQVPMDSLRSEPEAIKKAKIVFDPSKVPEKDRSAALAISLPMPDKSSIINMFHDGSFYVYKRKDGKPIEDSIIQRIIEGQDIPISTGETFMGAWNQDTGDSRGSASFKELTAMAQDANQPDDPTKPLIFEKITNSYTHGYLTEFIKSLKEANRMFSAKPKKNKK